MSSELSGLGFGSGLQDAPPHPVSVGRSSTSSEEPLKGERGEHTTIGTGYRRRPSPGPVNEPINLLPLPMSASSSVIAASLPADGSIRPAKQSGGGRKPRASRYDGTILELVAHQRIATSGSVDVSSMKMRLEDGTVVESVLGR